MGVYTIKSGDTLARIAKQYGTTVDALAKANGISNPDSIMPGKKLEISTTGTTVERTSSNLETKSDEHILDRLQANSLKEWIQRLTPEERREAQAKVTKEMYAKGYYKKVKGNPSRDAEYAKYCKEHPYAEWTDHYICIGSQEHRDMWEKNKLPDQIGEAQLTSCSTLKKDVRDGAKAGAKNGAKVGAFLGYFIGNPLFGAAVGAQIGADAGAVKGAHDSKDQAGKDKIKNIVGTILFPVPKLLGIIK